MPGDSSSSRGPSGAGKSTVVRRAGSPVPPAARPERFGHHPAPPAGGAGRRGLLFPQRARSSSGGAEAGEFLECNEVFGRGHWYGTLQSEVASRLGAGKWVILEIDVEGAMSVLAAHTRGGDHLYPPRLAGRARAPPAAAEHRKRRRRSSVGWKSPAANWLCKTSIPGKSTT